MNPNNFKFIDLFAGIGGIRIPFEEFGGECVFSSDWDEDAQKVYKHNFNEMPEGDISKISVNNIPKHDLLLAGFPCQSFSIMGKGEGFADKRGTAFFEIERILDHHRPAAVLLENVKQLKTHDKGKTFEIIKETLERLGYTVHVKILNALNFGLPQKRERTFIVGFQENYKFNFPQGINKEPDLQDILEDDDVVDDRWEATDYIKEKRQRKTDNKDRFYPSIWHENRSGNIGINSFACALRASASHSYQLVNGVRRLSPREQLRLQGFPDDFEIEKVISQESKIRKLTGNSVPVAVVRAVAEQMLKSIRHNERIPEQKKIIK